MADQNLEFEFKAKVTPDEASADKTGEVLSSAITSKLKSALGNIQANIEQVMRTMASIQTKGSFDPNSAEAYNQKKARDAFKEVAHTAGNADRAEIEKDLIDYRFEKNTELLQVKQAIKEQDREAAAATRAQADAQKALNQEMQKYADLSKATYAAMYKELLDQRDQEEKVAQQEQDARVKAEKEAEAAVAAETQKYAKLGNAMREALYRDALQKRDEEEAAAAAAQKQREAEIAAETEKYAKLNAASREAVFRDLIQEQEQREAEAASENRRNIEQTTAMYARMFDEIAEREREQARREKEIAQERAENEKFNAGLYTSWWRRAIEEREEAERKAAEAARELNSVNQARESVAKWHDNNGRDLDSQSDYNDLKNMYSQMEKMSGIGVADAYQYGGFEGKENGLSRVQSALLGIVNTSPGLVKVYQALQKINTVMQGKADTPLSHALHQVAIVAKKAASAGLSSLSKGFDKLKGAASRATGILGRFGKVMIWRLYRTAAMLALRQISQGFKNLTAYSREYGTQFSENVDKLRVSVTYLANAFAAMLAPAINAVTPMLEALMDAMARMFNRIGQMIATSLGQKQFSAALKGMVSDAKKGSGKMKDILGFDEINRLSGDTGAGDASSRQFEEWGPGEKSEEFAAIADAFERIKTAIEEVGTAFRPIWDLVIGLALDLLPIVADLIARIVELTAPIISALAPAVEALIQSIMPIVEAVLPVIISLLETVMPLITRIVTVVSKIIQSVAPLLVAVIRSVADIIEIVIHLMSPVLEIITFVIETVGGVLTPIIDALTAAIELVADVLDPIVVLVKGIVDFINSLLRPVLDVVKGIFIAIANVLSGVFLVAIRMVQAAISALTPVIEFLGQIFSTVAGAITTVWEKVKNAVMTVVNVISSAWSDFKDMVAKGGEIFVGIKDSIAQVFVTIVNGVISGINWIIAQPFNLINGVLRTIRDITILGAQPFKEKIRLITVPQIPAIGLAEGGAVPNTDKGLKGTLINVNEAGPEVIANQGRSTGVMNTDQMEAAIAAGNENVVEALFTVMSNIISTVNNKDLDVYLDGAKVGQSVTEYQNNYARRFGV